MPEARSAGISGGRWSGIHPWHWMVFSGFLAIHLALGWSAAAKLSPTFDEPIHLTAGYAYWTTGDYRLNGLDHPAFAKLWATTPLLLKDVDLDTGDPLWSQGWPRIADQFVFADGFLYENNVSADDLLVPARRTMLLLSPLLALGIFLACAGAFGPRPALGAVGLYAFSPEMLAHAGLVTTDFALAVFYFLFFFLFVEALRDLPAQAPNGRPKEDTESSNSRDISTGERWPGWESRRIWWWVGAGVMAGLALTSKYSAVALGPAALLVLGLEAARRRRIPREWIMGLAALTTTCILVVVLVYRVHELPVFFQGLKNVFQVIGSRDTFLWGRNSDTGVWYYFPLTFLIKTPLPELLVVGAGIVLAARGKLRGTLVWVLPALTFFAMACTSKMNIGHRHILPVYPFLFVLAAAVLSTLRLRTAILSATILISFQAMGSWRSSPEFLAYFNELVGGSKEGYHYLTDSNVDWGQGLRALSEYFHEEGVGPAYLSYFGSAKPAYEGLDIVHVGSFTLSPGSDSATLEEMEADGRCIFAISVTNFQHTYYQNKELLKWLRAYQPMALVARSILVFDLTDTPSGRRHLADLLSMAGKEEFAAYERSAAASME